MRKLKFLPLLFVLGIVLFSCEKDSTKEWEYKYGFTVQDIVGQYTYSGIPNAFEGIMESEFMHICQDAIVDITYGGNMQFHINCPSNAYNRTFTGQPTLDADSFLIHMAASHSSYSDAVTAYVYTNKQGRIRLHGYASKPVSSPLYSADSKINYYFDVIKR